MATTEIVPLAPDDVEELSTFLTQGFELPPDCDYFTPEALRWKYFDASGSGEEPRSFIGREDGRIIGHMGLCLRSFEAAGKPGLAVPTAHGIDWLVAPGHRGVGVSLILKALSRAGTLYSIGGSQMALPVLKALKFEAWQPVRDYRRILRPLRRLHDGPAGLGFRLARLARDISQAVWHRPKAPAVRLTLRALAEVGPEINQILASGPPDVLCTTHTPQLLNYFLRYPHAPATAWGLYEGSEVRGYALLRMKPTGTLRQGKIIECYVGSCDPRLWHAAYAATMNYFYDQKADYVTAYASTPWASAALESCGFRLATTHQTFLLDKRKTVPRSMTLHLSMLEGDNALLD